MCVTQKKRHSPRMRVTSDGQEAALVALGLDFANGNCPTSAADVEAHFAAHPFAARSPFWQTITHVDPAALAFEDDWLDFRTQLDAAIGNRKEHRDALRVDVERRL